MVGEFSSIGPEAWIGPKVTLGKYVLLAPRVSIKGDDHFYDQVGVPIIFSGRPDIKPTVIEDDAWLGQNVCIVAGVRIGRGAIIGMGAVVTRDVEPYAIVAGVPAKKIGVRFQDPVEIKEHDRMLVEVATSGRFCDRKGDLS
ncbi:MAG: DapH/DapD/GlmU-related protein [Lentimonas sp.]